MCLMQVQTPMAMHAMGSMSPYDSSNMLLGNLRKHYFLCIIASLVNMVKTSADGVCGGLC